MGHGICSKISVKYQETPVTALPDKIRLVKVVRQGLPPLTHLAHSLVWLRGEPGLWGTGHCSGDLRSGLLVGADIEPAGSYDVRRVLHGFYEPCTGLGLVKIWVSLIGN